MLARSVSKKIKIFSSFLVMCGLLAAQQAVVNEGGSMPVYRVTVVARTMKAINYNHRSGATKIDFRGTPLLPRSHGEAKVESKQGYIEMKSNSGSFSQRPPTAPNT